MSSSIARTKRCSRASTSPRGISVTPGTSARPQANSCEPEANTRAPDGAVKRTASALPSVSPPSSR